MGMICYLRMTTDDEIAALLAQPNQITEYLLGTSEIELEIGKTWHGLHYILTGRAWDGDWPGNFLLQGGSGVCDIGVGYGPAHVLTSTQVAEVNQFLATRPVDDLASRFIFSA
jgi:hypothetical protein